MVKKFMFKGMLKKGKVGGFYGIVRFVVSLMFFIYNKKHWLFMTMGTFLMALSISKFALPYHFIDGGVSGISILFTYITGITPGVFIVALNIPLFLWGARELDKWFVVYSIYCVVMFSIFIYFTKFLWPNLYFDDLLLVALYGGVIKGIGGGLVFLSGGSMGGLDIVSLVLRKRYSLDVGKVGFFLNTIIVSFASVYLGIKPAMYTLVAMFVFATVVDTMLNGFSREKMVLIVTNEPKLVVEFILHKIGRGVTLLEAEGAYTGVPKKVIWSMMRPRQVLRLKRFLAEHDPHAFVVITTASEVMGKGFIRLNK